MDHPHNMHHKPKSIFDVIPAKSSFWLGFITAVLAIGTLGFIILGSCMLSDDCSIGSVSKSDSGGAAVIADAGAAYPDEVPEAAPANVPEVTDDDHIRGNKNAKVTIVEYSDFECPFCSRFHPTVQQVIDEYPNDVRWVYRHFPLSFHPQAGPAAEASECAAEQGKFWEYADELFANQSALGDSYYKQLASTLGLNVSKFNDCLDTNKYAQKVSDHSSSGAASGVTGTPGSFIIGEDGTAIPLKGALPYASVKAAVDQLL